MTAGLLQLNFIGPQDKYLTGNPQMTYFKSVYRNYSNFSKDSQILQFENTIRLGGTHSCIIKNYGDLLSSVYLYVELPRLVSINNNENWVGYVNGIGCSIIKSVELEIGGQVIDKFDSNWLDIYNEIFDQRSDNLYGKFNTDVTLEQNNYLQKLHIPLNFWFSKNYGNVLPLIALQFHEIKINVEFRNLNEIIKSDTLDYQCNVPNIKSHILANYIHLDKKEQLFFTNNIHTYLIDQVQILSETDINNNTKNIKVPLDFSHPVKSLYWVIVNNTNNSQNIRSGNNWLTYTSIDSLYGDTFYSAKITINGQDRVLDTNASYFRDVICYETQTYVPRKYIYNYSFSLYPGQYQPSGSCNYSRIQNNASFLELSFDNTGNLGGATNGRIKTYGLSYNIFQVQLGKGGLLFTN